MMPSVSCRNPLRTNLSALALFTLAAFLLLHQKGSSKDNFLGRPWWKFGGGKDADAKTKTAKPSDAFRPTQESYAIEVTSVDHFVHLFKNTNIHDTVVVDLYGPNCPYCVQIAPFYERLAAEFKDYATFLKVNVQKIPELAEGVEGLPTFIFLCRGQNLGMLPGADPKALVSVTQEAVRKCMETGVGGGGADSKKSQTVIQPEELCPASAKFEKNVNYYGGTIPEGSIPAPDLESCCGLCALVKNCEGYTFEPQMDVTAGNGTCYLKESLENKVKVDPTMGFVSGIISDAQRQEVTDMLQEKYGPKTEKKNNPTRPHKNKELPRAECKFEPNMDYSSHDLPDGNLRRADQQACCDYCAASSDCKGFTFMAADDGEEGGWCFMKSSTTGKRQADPRMKVVSGYVVEGEAQAETAASV